MSRSTAIVLALLLGPTGCLANELNPKTEEGDEDTGSKPNEGDADDGATGSDGDIPAETGDTGGGGAGEVACDTQVCMNPDVCCASMSSSGCEAECDPDEATQSCDGPEDCSTGEACCFGLVAGTSCFESAAACTGTAWPEVVCHTDADCPTGTCAPHMFVGWISVCG